MKHEHELRNEMGGRFGTAIFIEGSEEDFVNFCNEHGWPDTGDIWNQRTVSYGNLDSLNTWREYHHIPEKRAN